VQEIHQNVTNVKPQLDELSNLSKDVLNYLNTSEVTSMSIRGDLSALADRYTQ
jgi:hypothetical protein